MDLVAGPEGSRTRARGSRGAGGLEGAKLTLVKKLATSALLHALGLDSSFSGLLGLGSIPKPVCPANPASVPECSDSACGDIAR